MKFEKKHKFVKYSEGWPEWANYIIGVASGYETFESESEGEKFLEKYHEEHKDDYKNEKIEEEKKTTYRKIGFGR